MTGTEAEQLWEYQVQLRRTAAGREEDAEEQIRRAYQQILQKLLSILGKYYAAYGNAEDGAMTQGDLRAAGQYKNFLQDVVDNLDGIAEPVDKQIRQAIEETYTACYDGMVNAVKQSTAGNISLQSSLSGLSACTPETVKHIVENPMDKLKLSTVLNRRRSQIVTSAKKTLAVGLASGDSYTRMAQRIAETLNGDYKKAMRIVRTEANRAINRGFQDVTEEAAELLLNSEYVEVKEWCSMEDDSVRDTHRHLNGKKIHALDVFHSGGAAADCPGGFGVAGEEINCRCFLKYSFMLRSEFLAQGGVIPGAAKEHAELEQTEKTPEQQLQPESESAPQPSPVNASSVGHSVEVDVKTPKDNGGTGETYREEKIPWKALTSGGDGDIIDARDISSRNLPNGMRTAPSHILTDEEISNLKVDISEIGADESVFKFNTGRRTGYDDILDEIRVRGDVLPDENSNHPRDRMSARAALAHEYYGHRAYRGTDVPNGAWNDEFRASYMAAKKCPNLSDEDRRYLILDALERAKESGVTIKYNDFIRKVLYGY